ncbi:GNAT family N-acetyltransferase [Shouchella clausii]
MGVRFKPYTPDDLVRVRDFLSGIYTALGRPNCWLIDRWEFVIYFQETQNGTLKRWEQCVGLWEREDGGLAGVACRDGDMYFQFDTLEPAGRMVDEMLGFAERCAKEEGAALARVCIPDGLKVLEDAARARGYTSTGSFDEVNGMELTKASAGGYPVRIPPGFRLCAGTEADDRAKALGHIHAFGYAADPRAELTLHTYGNLRNAPDYDPELDLCLLNEAGEVVSFCNIFYDKANRIGSLEPVGTHAGYRRLGLARALLHEGFNRLMGKGAVKVFTGPSQPFYEQIGFRRVVTLNQWESPAL